jgi:CheY-like chemotaxis protein
MPVRILLFHWNAAEAAERAAWLREAGYAAEAHAGNGSAEALREIRANPPDAFVVDLRRIPSHGRAVAAWLRETKATRYLPIVFVEGDAEKTEGVRALFPDADFTDWDRMRSTLRGALRSTRGRTPSTRSEPARPGVFAGYSGTPLPKKLGLKSGVTLMLLDAPIGFERVLGDLPSDTRIIRQARGDADVILLFAKSMARLTRRFPTAAKRLVKGGRLWLVWPKKSSGVSSDLSERSVRAFGLASGFVDYKISAIDPTWSGLCFARRVAAPRRT